MSLHPTGPQPCPRPVARLAGRLIGRLAGRLIGRLAGTCLAVVLLGGCSSVFADDAAPLASASTAPESATSQAFCAAYQLDDASPDADDAVSRLRAGAVALRDSGTPDDIPSKARVGFVHYVAAIADATDEQAQSLIDATSGDQVAPALDVGADQTSSVKAFQAYVAGTCFVSVPG